MGVVLLNLFYIDSWVIAYVNEVYDWIGAQMDCNMASQYEVASHFNRIAAA